MSHENDSLITPWQVVALPAVYMSAADHGIASKRFRRLGLSINSDRRDNVHGLVVWGLEAHGKMLAIGWEWMVVQGRAVAMSDPLTLISNLRFIDDEGGAVTERAQLFQLHGIVHKLKWQEPIRSAVHDDGLRIARRPERSFQAQIAMAA